jgi:tetratricopeptide (TPR) repeat protein
LALAAISLAACNANPADPLAQARSDCAKQDAAAAARIAACSKLANSPGISDADHAAALADRGEAEQQSNDAAAALRDYTAALALDRDNMVAVRGRADVLIKSGQLDAADALVERLVASGQFTAEAHFMQGKMAYLRSDYASAITAFTATLADDPQFTDALAERARAKQAQGDGDGAAADFDAAIAREPGLADARAGRCWLRLRKKPESGTQPDDSPARADANAAVAADPHNFEAQLCLAMLQARAGDWSNAAASFAVAANLNPGNPMALFGRGLARKRAGDGAGVEDMNQARDFSHGIDGTFIDLGIATY